MLGFILSSRQAIVTQFAVGGDLILNLALRRILGC